MEIIILAEASDEKRMGQLDKLIGQPAKGKTKGKVLK